MTIAAVPTRTSPLDEAIERYATAIWALEDAAPKPSFEEIVEALVARDALEKTRQIEQTPPAESIAKIIQLDSRLKEQALFVASNEKFPEWKKSVNAPSTSWWWDLEEPAKLLPTQAVERYATALRAIEESAPNPSLKQIQELLLARDAVEEVQKKNQPLSESITKTIIELDDSLRAQAGLIAQCEKLADWKKSVKSTQTVGWWWEVSPSLDQAIKGYEQALEVVEKLVDAGSNPSEAQVLEVLLARDAVEKFCGQNQPPANPDWIDKLSKLDQRLKQQQGAIAKGNRLDLWKQSLNPPTANNWWWNLNPILEEADKKSASWVDWLCHGLAVALLTTSGAYIANTGSLFQGDSKATTDVLQHFITFAQTALVAGGAAGTLTKRGNEVFAKILASMKVPSNKQAQTTLILSAGICGVTGLINNTAPTSLATLYTSQGQKLFDKGEYYSAQKAYEQALKFDKDNAKIYFRLGQTQQKLGRLPEAQKQYDEARKLDPKDPELLNALAKALVFQKLETLGWTGKLSDGAITLPNLYLDMALQESDKEKDEGLKLGMQADIWTNKGILDWAPIDFPNLSPDDFKDKPNDPKIKQYSRLLKHAMANFEKGKYQAEKAKDLTNKTPERLKRDRCFARLAKIVYLAYNIGENREFVSEEKRIKAAKDAFIQYDNDCWKETDASQETLNTQQLGIYDKSYIMATIKLHGVVELKEKIESADKTKQPNTQASSSPAPSDSNSPAPNK